MKDSHVSMPKSSRSHQIQRQSIPEALAESLRERILSGEFKGGDALIQDNIAREYDVSRMPVREALRQLEAAGFVQMKLHRGAVVTSMPAAEIEELFELRALLEGDMLARAIPRMTEADRSAAQAILNQLERSYKKRDVAKFGQLNWEFHRALYNPAQRPQSLTILHGIHQQTDRYIRLHLFLTEQLQAAEQDHRELLRLCAQRDVTTAVSYLREHISNTSRHLMEALNGNTATKPTRL